MNGKRLKQENTKKKRATEAHLIRIGKLKPGEKIDDSHIDYLNKNYNSLPSNIRGFIKHTHGDPDIIKPEEKEAAYKRIKTIMNEIAINQKDNQKDKDNKLSIGKNGGEFNTTPHKSMLGYKDDSPYRHNKSNDIYSPNGTITMNNVSTPLLIKSGSNKKFNATSISFCWDKVTIFQQLRYQDGNHNTFPVSPNKIEVFLSFVSNTAEVNYVEKFLYFNSFN